MIADTSFLFSLFASFDTNHPKAEGIFASVKAGQEVIRVPSEVLTELYTVMAYKVGKNDAQAAVELFFSDSLYHILDFLDMHSVLSYLKSVKPPISYYDAAVLMHAAATADSILAFDWQILSLSKKSRDRHQL